ncbi:hypothetical protein ABLO01_20960, partial [Mycobacterium tuberculosis]
AVRLSFGCLARRVEFTSYSFRIYRETLSRFRAPSITSYDFRIHRGSTAFRAPQLGRDFMWNSGVFSVDVARAEWPLHAMAAAIFATYPFFIKLGRRLGRRI